MTKDIEERLNFLLQICSRVSDARSTIGEIKFNIEQFFSQNVVMPRGKNRHPYADVLHEWIEGAEIEFESYHGGLLSFTKEIASTSMLNCKSYRIKPFEPVHEWMWYSEDGEMVWWTIAESASYNGTVDYYRADQTKRIRNA